MSSNPTSTDKGGCDEKKQEENPDESLENFRNWIHCVCVVTFDLELGQALEATYPKDVALTKEEISNICYLAFPDSNSGCMGDTNFIIRLHNSPEKQALRKEHAVYNTKCSPALQIQPSYFWGYVYFRQVKDISLPRGYFQKSLVILTRLPFNNLFLKMSSLLAPEFFEHGELSIEASLYNVERWPPPVPGETLNLPLLGSVFQVYIPQSNNTLPMIQIGSSMSDPAENQIHTSVEDLDYFDILQPVLPHIHLLWELVLTSEPLVVMSISPTHCSSMVLALTRMISPLKYCGDYRPYFTIHDSKFKELTSRVQGTQSVILGVTNPFFSKILNQWPHTIRLGLHEVGQSQKYNIKKNATLKMLDNSPGVYTSSKPFLQKDKAIIKKLLLGVSSKRPTEVQSALLRRHLLELTESFMIPLERYIASLMPLQKNISPFKAAPTPLPFAPHDFFATLENTGPQLTTMVKGDWIGLYKKFLNSPNFQGWYHMRYTDLALKLQALHLEALSDADFKHWVHNKPEVEVVDMVLKIRHKINKCSENNIPVNDNVKDKLIQRLQDIITSLPDDLKNILQTT